MAWIDRDEPWHRTQVDYCDVTGQLLPRRYWQFTWDGVAYRVRDPGCEELFRRYVLGRGERGGEAAYPSTAAVPAYRSPAGEPEAGPPR